MSVARNCYIQNADSISISAVFKPQPAAIWMMNEEWELKDQSGFGNDGTKYGVTLADGPMGEKRTAFAFAGSENSYLRVPVSDSLDVGHNGSFAFTSWVYLIDKTAVFVEYSPPNYGVHIWSWSTNALYANLPPNVTMTGEHQINFGELQIPLKSWAFIGISYDKASGKVIGLVGDKTQIKTVGSYNLFTKTSYIILGKRQGHAPTYLRGSMSCAMMFSVELSVADMNRAMKYCIKMAKPFGKLIDLDTQGKFPPGTCFYEAWGDPRKVKNDFLSL
jgi:hypothetical protein